MLSEELAERLGIGGREIVLEEDEEEGGGKWMCWGREREGTLALAVEEEGGGEVAEERWRVSCMVTLRIFVFLVTGDGNLKDFR